MSRRITRLGVDRAAAWGELYVQAAIAPQPRQTFVPRNRKRREFGSRQNIVQPHPRSASHVGCVLLPLLQVGFEATLPKSKGFCDLLRRNRTPGRNERIRSQVPTDQREDRQPPAICCVQGEARV